MCRCTFILATVFTFGQVWKDDVGFCAGQVPLCWQGQHALSKQHGCTFAVCFLVGFQVLLESESAFAFFCSSQDKTMNQETHSLRSQYTPALESDQTVMSQTTHLMKKRMVPSLFTDASSPHDSITAPIYSLYSERGWLRLLCKVWFWQWPWSIFRSAAGMIQPPSGIFHACCTLHAVPIQDEDSDGDGLA